MAGASQDSAPSRGETIKRQGHTPLAIKINELPEADADQDVVCDEFSFEEIRLTKWRRCLTFLPEEDAAAGCLTLCDVSETLLPAQS